MPQSEIGMYEKKLSVTHFKRTEMERKRDSDYLFQKQKENAKRK